MLTDRKLRALAPKTKDFRVPDHEKGDDPAKTLRGFGVRVLPSGVITFYLDYRVDGVERRPMLGSFPTWTVAQARLEARRWRQLIDQGVDPYAERERVRTAPTVSQLAERYVEEILPKRAEGTRRGARAMLRQWILPAVGNTRVADLRPSDVERLHNKVTKAGSPIRANRVVALVSAMLSAAIRWEFVDKNVCRGAVVRNREFGRRRYLSAPEIVRLSEALSRCQSQTAADVLRLLLLTGARSREVRGMQWEEVDLDAGVWRKPAASTKDRRPHEVPLGAAALELLVKMRPRVPQGPVFPGTKGAAVLDIRSTWRRVLRDAGLEDLRIHDLRHSFASILISGGASLPLIGSLLGHSNPSTTARYSHLFLDPQRAAVEKVGAIIGNAGSAEVVPLKRGR